MEARPKSRFKSENRLQVAIEIVDDYKVRCKILKEEVEYQKDTTEYNSKEIRKSYRVGFKLGKEYGEDAHKKMQEEALKIRKVVVRKPERIKNTSQRDDYKKREDKFSKVLGEADKAGKFCKLEKCQIKTAEGKRVVKREQTISHTPIKRTKEYIDDLEKRDLIQRSSFDWKN